MLVKRPINKPRWFGLTCVCGGSIVPVDPNTKPDGDKVVTGAGFQGSALEGFNPQVLDDGVYLMSCRNDDWKDRVTPDNTLGRAYLSDIGGTNTSNTAVLLRNRLEVNTNKVSCFHYSPNILFTGEPLVLGGGLQPKSKQYFLCPVVRLHQKIETYKDFTPMTYGFNTVYSTQPFYDGWYSITTEEPVTNPSYITNNRIASYNKIDLGNSLTMKNLRGALFSILDKDFNDLTPYVNVNLTDLGYEINYNDTSFPNMVVSSASTQVMGVSWNLPGTTMNYDTHEYNEYSLQNVWMSDDGAYSIGKLMHYEVPATYEESLPFRCGGVVRGQYYLGSNQRAGLYGVLIFGGQ